MKIFSHLSTIVLVGIVFTVYLSFVVTALVLHQTNVYFVLLGFSLVIAYILYIMRTVLKVSMEINKLCEETSGVISKLKKR